MIATDFLEFSFVIHLYIPTVDGLDWRIHSKFKRSAVNGVGHILWWLL